jgi:hypothetical protein
VSKRTIDELLSHGYRRFSPLQKLLNHAASRDAWTQELRAVVPRELRHHYSVAALRGDELVVLCSNASSATRLRFLAPDIIERLKALAHFRQLAGLSLKIADNASMVQSARGES